MYRLLVWMDLYASLLSTGLAIIEGRGGRRIIAIVIAIMIILIMIMIMIMIIMIMIMITITYRRGWQKYT